MSRMLTSSIVLGAWSLAVWGGMLGAFAQAPPGTATVREPRPRNAALEVQNLSPELDQLLRAWSEHSAKIQKLQGEHQRHVYDTVFNVEKRSTGVFYYEAPGKGRIDLTPAPIQKGEVSKKTGTDGKAFKLEADRSEKWLCDGKDIWQVNDAIKQVDIFAIPQENQGQNIMDGPMPFLFGMPPAKAKMRYVLELELNTPQQARIKVRPRWQVDAENWKEAWVILDKTLYLPTAVKLIDPSGNLETVYQFGNFQVNKANNLIVRFFGPGDPFRPKLNGYAIKVHKGDEAPPAGPAVPSVAGMGWKDAKELLEKLDCQVKLQTGQNAPQAELSYVVYDQKPAAKTPLQKGQEVVLTIYNLAAAKPAAQQGQVPQVMGLFWKEAGAKLEQAGYKVKYLRGKVSSDESQIFKVYQQAPTAGQALKPGSEVTLTVYTQAAEPTK